MITVTDAAQTHLKPLMEGHADKAVGLRLYVEQGGCAGFNYGMGLDEKDPADDDQVVEVSGWLKVYIDNFSKDYLDGVEIDYVDALMGGGFAINNPNATKSCGCGHSFQTADGAGTAASCSN